MTDQQGQPEQGQPEQGQPGQGQPEQGQQEGQLEALRAEVTALRDLVDQSVAAAAGEQDAAADAVARLEETVTDLITQQHAQRPEQTPGPPGVKREPVAWVDYAGGEDWVALADWVDWLAGTYDLAEARRVRSCWPAHLGVVEELAALRSAWREAAGRARGAHGDALAFWHDRYLAPFLARVNSQYGTIACHSTRHCPVMAAPVSDRTLIDVRSAAVDGVEAGPGSGAAS